MEENKAASAQEVQHRPPQYKVTKQYSRASKKSSPHSAKKNKQE
jgi:hypothetical protein